jgi:hypothetical protein
MQVVKAVKELQIRYTDNLPVVLLTKGQFVFPKKETCVSVGAEDWRPYNKAKITALFNPLYVETCLNNVQQFGSYIQENILHHSYKYHPSFMPLFHGYLNEVQII